MKEADLIKFIEKKGDNEFNSEVISWINASQNNQALFSKIKAKHVIDTLDSNTESTLATRKYNEFLEKKKAAKKPLRFLLRVASIIILPLLFSTYLYFNNQNSTTNKEEIVFTSSVKEQKTVTLKDGTVVWLNADSKIVLDNEYNSEERRLKLYGEAFFDVVKNKDKPFIVETVSGIKIKVLGTTFNVKSYSSEKNVETTLVTGKVELYDQKEDKALFTLSPKQKATFSKKEKELSITEVATENITSWKSGRLIFDKTPLDEFALNIERWFEVKVVIASNNFKGYSFSGKIDKTNSIDDIMKVLEVSSNLNCTYSKNTNTIVIISK
jgi:transmembrane sensor